MHTRVARRIPLVLVLTCLSLVPKISAAVSSTFTYQGSLKQNGVPVNGDHSMEFRLTNSAGSQVYWTSGVRTVSVTDGLYRVELSPSNVNWSTADPYIEVRVGGSSLLPRERITSGLYALMARELDASASARGDIGVAGKITVVGPVHSSSDVIGANLISQGRVSATGDLHVGGKLGLGVLPSARLTILDRTGQAAGNTNALFGAGYGVGSLSGNRQFWIQQWINTATARTFLVGNGLVSGSPLPTATNGPYTPFQAVEFNDNYFGFVWNNNGAISPGVVVVPGGNIGVRTSGPSENLEVVGRTKIVGPIAEGHSPGDGPFRGTLRIVGEGDRSNGRLLVLQAPWDSAYQTDRHFVIGYHASELKFFVRGDGAFFSASSRALKDEIERIAAATALVKKINGVRYKWKNEATNRGTLGFIAEDLAKVLPDAVENNTHVNYDAIVPVLLEAIKELTSRIEHLEAGKK